MIVVIIEMMVMMNTLYALLYTHSYPRTYI